MINNINKLDKVKIGIPAEHFKYNGETPKKYFLGGSVAVSDSKMTLEISGKINSTPNDFGSITEENIQNAINQLKKQGIFLDEYYFLNEAPVYRVDVKKDTTVEENPTDYISMLKELLKQHSDKYNITSHTNRKYNEGLQLFPIKKSSNYKVSIYAKYFEMLENKNKDYGYFDQFDYGFLEKAKQVLRTEIQLKSFIDMREHFQFDDKPTLSKIFDSACDVVSNKMQSLVSA